jgi:hypothetical protein
MNPLGKRNAVFSQREMYKGLYTDKFDKLLLREAGKIDYKLYHDNKRDEYYAHIKIPSEVVPKFYYDVVIQFFSHDVSDNISPSLLKYNVRFFSNDPAFVYTYLRVFLKNDMFIRDLAPRAPKMALKEDPKERNPYEIPGYVKSIYFAYLFMKMKNLFTKSNYSLYGKKYDKNVLLREVEQAERKIAKRQEEGQKIAKKKTQEEHEKIKEKNNARKITGNTSTPGSSMTKPAAKTPTVSSAKAVKSAKTVGHLKKKK